MLKKIKLDEIWNMKGYKGIHFDTDTITGSGAKVIRFGRRVRRDPTCHTNSYFSAGEKEFARMFNAKVLGEVTLPKEFRAAVNMCDHVSKHSTVDLFRFGFDLEGGWMCSYQDEDMFYENGPGSLYEFDITDSRIMREDVFQMFRVFDTVRIWKTGNGKYAFQLAELDGDMGFFSIVLCTLNYRSQKMVDSYAYDMAV